jgi:hypothetical protein
MIPEEYFQEHPDRYWLALAGPALTTGYALAKVRSASDAQQAWGYGALAAVCAAQVIGLLRLGPPGRARRQVGAAGSVTCPALLPDSRRDGLRGSAPENDLPALW